MFFKLALQSLLNRKASVLLTILAMAVSIFVLLSVEHTRHQAKESFSKTVSGVDLIVGARTSGINLLLYSVFRIGNPSSNINWQSYQAFSNNPDVAWSIPISLGDSHKGYRVVATNQNYFNHLKVGSEQSLQFSQGKPFKKTLEVVLGAEVAKKLNYKIGDRIILSHGITETSFTFHDNMPFVISGILAPTGTPIDQSLYTSLQAMELIHGSYSRNEKQTHGNEQEHEHQHEQKESHSELPEPTSEEAPSQITAFMLGLKSKSSIFKIQRDIQTYSNEPLSAILPGVTLSELWKMMGTLEQTLLLISILVVISALLGLVAMLLSTIRERSNEIKLLRIIGASPSTIFNLIQLEALMIVVVSSMLAIAGLWLCLTLAQNYLLAEFGLFISSNIFSIHTLILLAMIFIATLLATIIPAYQAYCKSLH